MSTFPFLVVPARPKRTLSRPSGAPRSTPRGYCPCARSRLDNDVTPERLRGPFSVTTVSRSRDPWAGCSGRGGDMVGHDAVANEGRGPRRGRPVVVLLGVVAVLAVATAVLVALLGGSATAQTDTDPGPQPYGGQTA